MKHRDRFAPPAVGAGSLLTAFTLLVLCVFALLSLSSARAEARLAEAAAGNTQAYYAADLEAEEIFARLRAGELPAGVQNNGAQYQYTCPVSPTQTLWVCLSREGERWQVLQWQVIPLDVPAEAPTLNLWDGTQEEAI